MYNLTKKSDPELVKEVKATNADEPFLELFNRHIPLYTNIVNNYSGKFYASGISAQDIMEDKYVIFLNAINSYNEEKKTKFSSWLGECTKYHCLNTLYKNNDYNKFIVNGKNPGFNNNDENNYLLEIPEGKNRFEENNSKEQLDYLIDITKEVIEEFSTDIKDPRVKKVFKARFGDSKKSKNISWKEVGAKVGISYQGALNIFNRSKKEIKNRIINKLKEKNLEFCEEKLDENLIWT